MAPGPYVLISVSDTGAGMSAEVIEHAFDPFFTTKPSGRGTGLELSMVYGFAKQSGGYVLVYSELGLGTTVKLFLPRAIGGGEAAAPADEAAAPVKGNGEKILVVEDDDFVRASATAQLAELGYAVTGANSATQALGLPKEEPGFDLLFTDVILPGGLNGRQLADEARKRAAGLPVQFASGYSGDIFAGGETGVQLIRKPYRRKDLAAKIRLVLHGRKKTAGAAEGPTDAIPESAPQKVTA